MKNQKRLLLFQWKYNKTPMSKFECFGHAVKGQCYLEDRVQCMQVLAYSILRNWLTLSNLIYFFICKIKLSGFYATYVVLT